MNENAINKFMSGFVELYSKAHKERMNVIKRYEKGLLSHEAYKELDEKHTVELETLLKVKYVFMKSFEQVVEIENFEE